MRLYQRRTSFSQIIATRSPPDERFLASIKSRNEK
jgi:hypothetical protein